MIVSFSHKGLEKFFKTGSKSGINPAFVLRPELQLAALDAAATPKQMDIPGWGLHALQGRLAGHRAVKVNANWRMTFRFNGENAEVLDLQDYH